MEETQRKITEYYKNDKELLQETTTRQDTQQDKELTKDTRTRQEIQDKALHRRTTPGHRKAKPKTFFFFFGKLLLYCCRCCCCCCCFPRHRCRRCRAAAAADASDASGASDGTADGGGWCCGDGADAGV
jgi:hypothetical protein